MDIRVLYGNAYGGYSLHDANRKVNGNDYAARVPLLVGLIVNSGASVAFLVEVHEETDSSFGSAQSGLNYLVNALKAVDADWALLKGRAGNHCLYRPSTITAGGAKNIDMPGGRSMTDFTIINKASGFTWHGVHAHFRADDHSPTKSRDKERTAQGKFVANYAGKIQNAIVTGDLNSSTEAAGHPRASLKAAGFFGLRTRGTVANGTRSTHAKSSSQHSWIEDIFTRKAVPVSNSSLILTGNASDHNGWLATTISWPDSGGVAITPGVRPVQSTTTPIYAGLPWDVRVRLPNLRVMDPVRFTKATLTENYCAPATLVLDGRTSDLDAAATIGSGVVMTDDQGAIRFSGPLTKFERRGVNGGQLTLTFRSDTIETAGRITWPSPAAPWTTAGQVAAYHVVSGPAETRMLTYLSAHLGASARAERKLGVYHTSATTSSSPLDFRAPASLGRGPSASTSSRFDILGEVLATLGDAAGLHFGIRQAYDGLTPYLEFYLNDAPDMSDWVRFGTPEAGGPYMLSDGWKYAGEAPAGTIALGAAGGEGTSRILNASTDYAAENLWRRRTEYLVDQKSQTDPTEIAAGLAKALVDKGAHSEVAVPLGSVPGIGSTIPIGAIAAATLDGQLVVDRIRQITTVLSSEDNQAPTQVGAVLGSPDAGVASPTWRALNDMLSRLRAQEHR